MKNLKSIAAVALIVSIASTGQLAANRAWAQTGPCTGDCNHDDRLTIDELVTGVNMALGTLPIARCPDFDPGGNETVTVDELIAAVGNALSGCGSQPNRAPSAEDVSFSAEPSSPYVDKQLVGSDPDNDVITYELVADTAGPGYSFAHVNPTSGVLYITVEPEFEGTIVLPYRVTDGKRFSNTASATLLVEAAIASRKGGAQDIDPAEYATFPRGFYNGALLGAPGENPTLPSSVDLSKDFPLPGDQGDQSSCVGWALAYAIKSYQERVEHGWSLEPPEHRFSPSYIYNQINGGQDIGSRYRDGLDLVVDQGVAPLALMPYVESDYLSQPSAVARQEAARFRALSWNSPNGILEMKEALANHLPVFLVIQIFQPLKELWGPDSVYNTYTGPNLGGHAVAAVGYDDNRYGGAFRVINSWGRNWGDGGYFWLPYAAANYMVQTPFGPEAVLTGGVVLHDTADPQNPGPDPVITPVPGDLPDLQVTDWYASFDGKPGGSGSLTYTVTNTGIATAPAGAYIALVLSRDPTFANNSLVVYEPIPFDMPPGTTAYRDQNNAIAFYFPQDLEPGEYYMAAWVDIWGNVVESIEQDNISAANGTISIENTLPDMEVQTWYSRWDDAGNGSLTYSAVNKGASTAPAGWLVSFVLSGNDTIGDGDEIYLFSEPANFDLSPGGTLYRDESAPASFSIFYDTAGFPVPTGVYRLALWLDPTHALAESNNGNNASLSWGTVSITNGLSVASGATPDGESADALTPGEAYNGTVLPSRDAAVRTVRIREVAPGRRQLELLDSPDPGQQLRASVRSWSKFARARQKVVFPVVEAKPMP